MKSFQKRILIVLGTLAVIGLLIVLSGTWFSSGTEYPFRGQIVDLLPERRKVIVAHDEIPGYMQAMTMSFAVKDGEKFEELTPGDEISATLVVQEDRSWLQDIRILGKAAN